MALLNVGEAASKALNYRPDLVRQFPELSWYAMEGMRNRIAHSYWELILKLCGKL